MRANEEALKAARAELDRAQEDGRRARDAQASLTADLAALRTKHAAAAKELSSLGDAHRAAQAELAARVEAMASLEAAIAAAQVRQRRGREQLRPR